MFILQYKVSTTVIDLFVVFALFVFMLVLLCFCVATGFSVNKDLCRVVAAMAATRSAAGALRVVFLIDYRRGSNRRLAEGARYEPRISWPCLHGVVWRREALICRPAVRTVTPPSETVVVVGRFVYLCCSLGWDDSYTSCGEMRAACWSYYPRESFREDYYYYSLLRHIRQHTQIQKS